MIAPVSWASIRSSALFIHLWQSTIFLVAIWLLSLALRRNAARARYSLWMIASAKFLVPFSLLIAVGQSLHLRLGSTAIQPAFSSAIAGFEQPLLYGAPLTATTNAAVHTLASAPTHHPISILWLLVGLWAVGTLFLLARWTRSWWRIRVALRSSSPIDMPFPVPVRVVPTRIEPGVFGIFRPVLLLPSGLADHLNPSQLDAILAHELCHIRRRDNLSAALHMLVEVLFWFHPAVWWIQSRLLEERERACDEAVLTGCTQLLAVAETYAESILNVCKFYTEVQLPCISGITGSDLKQRIVRIMTVETAVRLNMPRKLMLGTAAALALGLPVVFGILHARVVHAQEVTKQDKGIESTSKGPQNTVSGSHATAQSQVAHGVDLSGDWQAHFSGASGGTRIVFRISKSTGVWHAIAYWADQNYPPTIIPVVTLRGDAVSFMTPALNGSFEGKLSTSGTLIFGNWTQGKDPKTGFPTQMVTMVRATKASAWTFSAPLISSKQIMAASLDPSFEVTTVKEHNPNQRGGGWSWVGARRFHATMTVAALVADIYGLQRQQILGAPGWAYKDIYDYAGVPDLPGLPTQKQRYSMELKLLEKRFQLKVHMETRVMSGFALTQAKSGEKIASSVLVDPGCTFALRPAAGGGIWLYARNSSMGDFKRMLQSMLDRPVVDQTGLTGQFDFDLTFMPDDRLFDGHVHLPPVDNSNPPPDLFKAMQEQLGLKLSHHKGPIEVLVIDHIARPSPN